MGFLLAWLVGEGIIIYRTSFKGKKVGSFVPPGPGQLMWSSGVFVLLALLADGSPKTRPLAITLAWGFDAAALLNLFSTDAAPPMNWPPPTIPDNQTFPSAQQAGQSHVAPGIQENPTFS